MSIEVNIKLWPSQTCLKFTVSKTTGNYFLLIVTVTACRATYSHSRDILKHMPSLFMQAQSTGAYSAVQREVYWGIRKHCQCNYNYFQYISLNNGYFTCAAGAYITFRANLYSTSDTADPADLKRTLTAWLHGQDTDKTITIYGMQYSVEPGPCGVTVPHLYAPKCSTPDTTATPSVAAISSTATATTTQDNTAVIVASVFAAMFFILSLGLIGYILGARR